MIPNHILTEIAQRLHAAQPEQIDAIARAVGIDPALATAPPPSIGESAPPTPSKHVPLSSAVLQGAVSFEMRLSVLGHDVVRTCRAVYSATLSDDVDRDTGEPIRVLAHLATDWQILDWRDLDQVDEETGAHPLASAPVWTDDFEGLLPTEASRLILDRIEVQVVALEQAGKSNS